MKKKKKKKKRSKKGEKDHIYRVEAKASLRSWVKES